MKKTTAIIFMAATWVLAGTPATAGFRYDPVYAPQICTLFQRDADRSMNDRYNPSANFKQTRLYIEGLPLPEVWEGYAGEIHRLARAEGMLKFRDELRRDDWLKKGYAWDEELQWLPLNYTVPLSDDAIYWAFKKDGDLFEDPGLDAVDGRWPILYWDSLTGEANCSGVLIGPNHYLTAGHCVTNIYDRLAEGHEKYDNWYYQVHGHQWPFAGADEQEKADIMCGLTEVAFDFRVKWWDLPLVDKGFGVPMPVTSIEDLALLTDDDWREAFRAARSRQKNYKCKRAHPIFFETAYPKDYVVLELDGSPGFIHGWMDVSSDPPGAGSFHGVVVGHPSGCPQMLSLGMSAGAASQESTLVVSAYSTSGFSGGPTLFLETGKIEGTVSRASGLLEYFAACIDADVTSCQPTWVHNDVTYECGDDIPWQWSTSAFVDINGPPEDRGFCVARFDNMLHNHGTWRYFDQINELTLPDVSLCSFQPENQEAWSRICQSAPATSYAEIDAMRVHMLMCDCRDGSGPFGEHGGCGDPGVCEDPYDWEAVVMGGYTNAEHTGWHAASFSYEKPPLLLDLVGGEAQVQTLLSPSPVDWSSILWDVQPVPWTTWSAGANCFKTTTEWSELVVDEYVASGAEDGYTRVHVCREPALAPLDKAGLPPIYIWGGAPALLSYNLGFQWKAFKEIWWGHNVDSAVWHVTENNLDASYWARFAVVAEYLRKGSWIRSRVYDERHGYFDQRRSRYFRHPIIAIDWPTQDFPMPGFELWPMGGASKGISHDIDAPGPALAVALDDGIPILVQASSDSQSLPHASCGFEREGAAAEGNAQGASLAFVDPQRGRVMREICANESADGSFPRAMNPAFEVLGWLPVPGAMPRFAVASYGGVLADGTFSDDLLFGFVQTDEAGVPQSLKWEMLTAPAGAFRPPGLDGARLVRGYGGEGLYLVGGYTMSGNPGGLHLYRPGSNTWESIPLSGETDGVLVKDAAVVRHTNVVYFFGGVLATGALSDGLYALYLPSGLVERVADGPPEAAGRRGSSLAISENNGRIHLYGGRDSAGWRNDVWSLALGDPASGWELEAGVCVGRNCPNPGGAVLLIDRVEDAPVVATSQLAWDPAGARSWKRTAEGWVFDRELGGFELAADCDGDGEPDSGWGAVCGQGEWWKELGTKRCDIGQRSIYCDAPSSVSLGHPRIYARPLVADFSSLGNLAAVARGRNVEIVDPDRGFLGPRRVGHVTLHGRVRAVATHGQVIYAAVWNGIAVIDAHVPEAPVVAGWLTPSSSPTDIVVSDGRLWVVDYEGLSAYILRDALAPEPGASVGLFSECGWAEWLDHWCEAGWEEGSGQAQPWEEELCALLPHRLDAHYGTVAVSSDREVILIRAEDPEAMTPAVVFDTGVLVNRVRLFGAYLYVAGPFGNRVLHVRDPLTPEIVSSQQEEPVRSWVKGRERIGGYMARTSNLGFLTFMAVEKE